MKKMRMGSNISTMKMSSKALGESQNSGPPNTLADPKNEYIYGYLSPGKKSSARKQSTKGNVTFGASPSQSVASSKLNQ